MKKILLTLIFVLGTFSFAQYNKGNTVLVWTKLKYKQSLQGIEGVSPKDGAESVVEVYSKGTK